MYGSEKSPSILKAAAFCISLSLITFFISCQKKSASGNVMSLVVDTGKLNTHSIDTGYNTIGAAIVKEMYAAETEDIRFRYSEPVTLTSVHNTIISGISTSQITLISCENITIKNCQVSHGKRPGINISKCTNIKIDSCYLSEVPTGISAENSQTVSVTNCQAKNMQGPFPEGQFVQFKNVSGAGNEVRFNKVENILGKSYAEDAISMLKSSGLPLSPILIESNWIRGGGPSHSGGGIMLGDGGGSYMVAKNNILVDPGEYGMAVSGGTNMSIVNNTIYGKAQSFTNVGLYYRNYSGLPSSNIFMGKNAVNFKNAENKLNNTYVFPADLIPAGWGTNIYSTQLFEGILPENIVYEPQPPPQ